MKIDGFPPPFSFWRPKKKTAVEPSKEKTPCRCAVTGAERPAAQRDAALNGPAQLRQRQREHGRGLAETSEPNTPCCTLRSSGKD